MKLNEDKNISATFKRLKIKKENEDELFKNLNSIYYLLFIYLRDEREIINDFAFIPNERREYKKLNLVFCNKGIDNDIKKYIHIYMMMIYLEKFLFMKK